MRYSVIVAEDGNLFHDEVEASSQEEAERKARELIAEAWDLQSGLDEARAEDDETSFDAGFDSFAVDPINDEEREHFERLADVVAELLDNRNDDYLHSGDREMLKEALLPVERALGRA